MTRKSNIIIVFLGLVITISIFGVIFANYQKKEISQQDIYYGTYNNPDKAYKECHKILMDLAKTMKNSEIEKTSKN